MGDERGRRGRFGVTSPPRVPRRWAERLPWQVVAPLLVAAILVAVFGGVWGISMMSAMMNEWMAASLRQTNASIVAHLRSRASFQTRDAARLALDSAVMDATRGSVHPTGTLVAYTASLPSGTPEVLTRLAVPASGWDDVALLSVDGRVLSHAGRLALATGAQVLSPGLARRAGTGTAFSSVIRLADHDALSSFAEVRAGDRRAILMLSTVIAPDLLREAAMGFDGGLAYFDRTGRPVARYQSTGRSGGVSEAAMLGALASDSPAALASPGALRETQVSGQRYLMLASPVDVGGGDGSGSLVAMTDDRRLQNASMAYRLVVMTWSMLGLIATALVGVVVARRVSRPLEELADTAAKVAEGDFSRKVVVNGTGEVADLAESFNRMTDSLMQRTDSNARKVFELTTLYEMSRQLGSTLEEDALLTSVLDSALRIFGVESGCVVRRDEDSDGLRLMSWRAPEDERPDDRMVRSSMSEWVVREGRPLIFNPPAAGEPGGGQVDTLTGATSALCVPLVSGDGIIGAVTVGSRDPAVRFVGDDVRLLSTIANHATMAIGNIDLFSTLQEAYLATVRSLAAAVDAKDRFTRGHSDRVAMFAALIAEQLGLSAEQRTSLEMSAYLHDIGKIGISEDILLKPDVLTAEEMAQMRHHPLIGANILRPVAFPWAVAPIVRHHHERWDGHGYPAGLRGEEIPLLARILTVADAFEAMTADRPYRPPLSEEEAVLELRRCAGAQFDPRCVDAFAAGLRVSARDRLAVQAQLPEDVQADEARAIFVALCDGMLASYRRLGGPRLAANLESELNRWFSQEGLHFSYAGGRLRADWTESPGDAGELRIMREVVGRVSGGMQRTCGRSLVDGFYLESLRALSTRMRLIAERLQLHTIAG